MYFLSFIMHRIKNPSIFLFLLQSCLLVSLLWVKKQQAKGEVRKRIKLFFHSVKKKLSAEKRKNPDISLLSPQDVGTLGHINALRPGSAPSPGTARSWSTGGTCGCPSFLHGPSIPVKADTAWRAGIKAAWETRGAASPGQAPQAACQATATVLAPCACTTRQGQGRSL